MGEQIVTLTQEGNHLKFICLAVGVCKQTVHNWVTKGTAYNIETRNAEAEGRQSNANPEHEPLGKFAVRYRKAQGEKITTIVGEVRKSGDTNALIWMLKTIAPEVYGEKGGKLDTRIADANRVREAREQAAGDPQLGADLDAMANRLSGKLGEK